MCLAIPKQVLSVRNDAATVKSSGGLQEVGSIVKVKKGDWVLTQNNIIVRKITKKDANEINKLLSKK